MRLCIIFFFFLLPHNSFASNLALNYEPSIVGLVGTLDLQTFPGSPNYENIQLGDEIERHFYLKLDTPVDVIPKGENFNSENSIAERNVKIVQLAISADDDLLWSKFRTAGKGAHMKIRGALFHRFTGHHHSRVLFNVESMEPVHLSK